MCSRISRSVRIPTSRPSSTTGKRLNRPSSITAFAFASVSSGLITMGSGVIRLTICMVVLQGSQLVSVQFACHRRLSVDGAGRNEGEDFCELQGERTLSHPSRQPHRHLRNDANRYIFTIDAGLPYTECLREDRGS